MSDKTGIEWTDATWNPIRGCSPVSPGCKNCYASKVAQRFSGPCGPYEGLVRINAAGERTDEWNGVVRPVEKHLLDPLKWKEPRRIFVNSMSDLFHENLPDEEIDKVFAVMTLCAQHTFQVLTKRPWRMLAYLRQINEEKDKQRWINAAYDAVVDLSPCAAGMIEDQDWPPRNIRLGVSIENQKAADERFDWVCGLGDRGWNTMASLEPLLGAVEIPTWYLGLRNRAWVIVGGESGPGARPFNTDWAYSIVEQCRSAGVACFVKQLGGYVIQDGEHRIKKDKKGGDMHEWPHEIRVREFPEERQCS